MENECFVIQPFSDRKFIKRFEDIYKPAIEEAKLVRTELADPSVSTY